MILIKYNPDSADRLLNLGFKCVNTISLLNLEKDYIEITHNTFHIREGKNQIELSSEEWVWELLEAKVVYTFVGFTPLEQKLKVFEEKFAGFLITPEMWKKFINTTGLLELYTERGEVRVCS